MKSPDDGSAAVSSTAFRGEDESAGASHPVLDLAAGIFLVALGLWFVGMSLALSVPGRITTAPGLLPFLTGASLAVMAGFLAFSAFRRRSSAMPLQFTAMVTTLEAQRRFVLIVCIVVYIAALDALSFEQYIDIAGHAVPVGSFEPVTVVALTTMLRFFWTRNIVHCLAVSVVWSLCLSLAFRGLFNIPMPG